MSLLLFFAGAGTGAAPPAPTADYMGGRRPDLRLPEDPAELERHLREVDDEQVAALIITLLDG